MAIACAYCNGEHDTPAQVRQCWNDGGRQDVPVAGDTMSRPADAPLLVEDPPASTTRPAPTRRGSGNSPPASVAVLAAVLERGVAPAGAGPDRLGRHLLIAPGGLIAAEWSGAERLVIDDAVLSAPGHALDRMRAAHHAATRLVIELATHLRA